MKQKTMSLVPVEGWVYKDCEICGSRFWRPLGRIKNSRFCSHPCYAIHRHRNIKVHHSVETRKKLSLQKLGAKNPMYHIPKEQHPCWKGGFNSDGRYLRATSGNKRYIHRQIMEKILGRGLASHEVVHHLNFNKLDNRPENLVILSRSEHGKIHRAGS